MYEKYFESAFFVSIYEKKLASGLHMLLSNV